MTRHARWIAVAAALLLGLWLIGPQFSSAADDEVPKDVRDAIDKITELEEKGKEEDAKKEAVAFVKKKDYDGGKVGGLKDPMHAFSLRSKGGLGIGSKANEIKPDGIEAKIMDLGKKTLPAATMKSQADDLKKMAYQSLALSEITMA